MSRELSQEDWRRVLEMLAGELRKQNVPVVEIIVIGGVAITLGYGSRRTTEDCDVIIEDESILDLLKQAARAVGEKAGLNSDWLNQNAQIAGIIPTRAAKIEASERKLVFRSPPLVVYCPDIVKLLAMKLVAVRSDEDFDDVTMLLMQAKNRFGCDDVESLWNLVGGLIDLDRRGKAHYNLLKAWEDAFDDEAP